MAQMTRILDAAPITSLDEYVRTGGLAAIRNAAQMSPSQIIDTIEASGLRGRGGAGFPTGLKWRTVASMESNTEPTTVVVNAAEGEPGTYKDRTLIRRNPYRVIEGSLIAARAVDAPRVVIAIKQSFADEIAALRTAIGEYEAEGVHDVSIALALGPGSYLFGEESAMLEVVDGRPPLPRVTPPYRRGVGEAGNSAAADDLAGETGDGGGPALVNNVETIANVAFILAEGVDEFRSAGTSATPGTSIVTLSGAVQRHGVAEFEMGTPLWEAIDVLGGGPVEGQTLLAAISGTANAALTADRFDTPLCFDAMADAGSGLGAAGFIVFDDLTDLAAAAHGVARFLAIESCGQCEPCKSDGGSIAEHLDVIRRSAPQDAPPDLDTDIIRHFDRVADGARCGLAGQQQTAVRSLYELARDVSNAHLREEVGSSDVELVAPIVSIVDDEAQLDASHLDKQPDWTTDGDDSGATPADRLDAR